MGGLSPLFLQSICNNKVRIRVKLAAAVTKLGVLFYTC